MADLEDLLREAAKRGITHLTLFPTPSNDDKSIVWAARATPSTEHKYIFCACADPVDALTQVLLALPKAPRRASPKAPDKGREPEFDGVEVTATVTEPATEAVPEPATSAPPLNLEEEFASWLPKP